MTEGRPGDSADAPRDPDPRRDEADGGSHEGPARRGRKPGGRRQGDPAHTLQPLPAVPAPAGDPSMAEDAMIRLKKMHLAPYIQLATSLIGKRRRSGGNMFRHQIDTMAILMDYGYIDSILLKASVIHDLLEDLPDFDRDLLLEIDDEAPEVYKLVLEVTRRPVESKAEFLGRILEYGSARSQVLKCADRISNMISLGYVTDVEFVRRYTDETEQAIFPMADRADPRMAAELRELVTTRREILALHPGSGSK
jgi:GTP pyrophosphokinase